MLQLCLRSQWCHTRVSVEINESCFKFSFTTGQPHHSSSAIPNVMAIFRLRRRLMKTSNAGGGRQKSRSSLSRPIQTNLSGIITDDLTPTFQGSFSGCTCKGNLSGNDKMTSTKHSSAATHQLEPPSPSDVRDCVSVACANTNWKLSFVGGDDVKRRCEVSAAVVPAPSGSTRSMSLPSFFC